MKRLLVALALSLSTAPLAASAAVTTIDFEVGAPCTFGSTSPLVTIGGATFAGIDGDGGSILDDCSGFGVDARSGSDFYAFNDNAFETGKIVDITFGGLIDMFSIWASPGSSAGTNLSAFALEAFLGASLVASTSYSPTDATYGQLAVFGAPIDRIRLTFSGDCCAVYDDLSFNRAPEPATLALLGLGLAGLAATRRRKQ